MTYCNGTTANGPQQERVPSAAFLMEVLLRFGLVRVILGVALGDLYGEVANSGYARTPPLAQPACKLKQARVVAAYAG
jgi:hypothetical protein